MFRHQAQKAMESVGVTSLDSLGPRWKHLTQDLSAALRHADGPLGTAIDLDGKTVVCVIVVKEEEDYRGFYM